MNSEVLFKAMTESVMLYNWRCFAQASFLVPEGSFALVDENGAGKSSLMSALYSLYTGRSWPGTKPSQNMRKGASYFGVLTDRPDWSYSGQVGSNGRVNARYQRPERQRVDGAWPTVFTYSPDDNYWLSLPRNIKLARLDQLIGRINVEYLELVQTLDKYVRAKQKVLKQDGAVDMRMIIVLTRAIHDLSRKIWEVREGFLGYLEAELPKFSEWIESPLAGWGITYEISDGSGVRRRRGHVEVGEMTEEMIERLWRKERMIGKVMYGAQRDEFQIESAVEYGHGEAVRAQHSLSRGENRLLTLYLKYLTQSRVRAADETARIWWFLDDVYNELDMTREDILQTKVLGLADFSIYSGTRGPAASAAQYSVGELRAKM